MPSFTELHISNQSHPVRQLICSLFTCHQAKENKTSRQECRSRVTAKPFGQKRERKLCLQSLLTPFSDCFSTANRRQLPESVQSEVKWQWWCPLPELQEAGSTRISLPLWACIQRHPSRLQRQQNKAQGYWVVANFQGSVWRDGHKGM